MSTSLLNRVSGRRTTLRKSSLTRACAAVVQPLEYRMLLTAQLGDCGTAPSGDITPDLGGQNLLANGAWLQAIGHNVRNDAVDPNSAAIMNFLGAGTGYLYREFGAPSGVTGGFNWETSGGQPYSVVPGNQPLKTLTVDTYWTDSDVDQVTHQAQIPIPTHPVIQGWYSPTGAYPTDKTIGDAHMIILVRNESTGNIDTVWESWQTYTTDGGATWHADSLCKFDLTTGAQKKDGATTGDAAGLPIAPLNALYPEVAAAISRGDNQGVGHPLRATFSLGHESKYYVWPAKHAAIDSTNPLALPFGGRLRLTDTWYQANKNNYVGQARVLVDTMYYNGLINADGGSDFAISGDADDRWNQTQVDSLDTIPRSAFEVLAETPMYTFTGPTSGAVGTPYTFTVQVQPAAFANFSQDMYAYEDGNMNVNWTSSNNIFDDAHRTLTFTYTPTVAGTHTLHVHSYNLWLQPPTITFTATTSGAPAAPSALTATATSSTQINTAWTDNANNETGFYIDRATDSGFANNLVTNSAGANVTTYSATGLTASTTYYFRVRAYNGNGSSSNTSTASATTQAAGSVPTAPSALTATATSSSQINTAWTDNANNETGFYIDQATNSGFTANLVTTSVGANVTTLSATGLTASTTYYFRVRAYNGFGSSANTSTASATTQAASGGLPAYDGFNYTSGTALNGASGGSGWSGNWVVTGDSPSSTVISSPGLIAPSPADTLQTSGLGVNMGAVGSIATRTIATPFSADGTTIWASTLIKVDTDATDQYHYSGMQVGDFFFGYTYQSAGVYYWRTYTTDTSWWGPFSGSAPVNGATYFMVAQLSFASGTETANIWLNPAPGSTAPSTGSALFNLSGFTCTPTSTTPVAIGANRYYNPSSFDEVRIGSTYADVAPLNATPPAAPSGLTATATSSSQINTAWTDNSNNETGFYIDRATNSGFTANLVTNSVGANVTTYNATGLTASTTYYFRVRAYNAGGSSANTATASATTQASLPGGWSDSDIGGPSAAGSASYNSGTSTWTISGNGADIWGASDQFNFAYESFTGDATAVAYVSSITNTSSHAKAGVMFRDSTAANAATALVNVTPGYGVEFIYRTSNGGTINAEGRDAAGTVPMWVKLVRSGNTFTGYDSTDGVTWTQVGTPQTITMASAALVGLAVASEVNGTLATGVISNVSISAVTVPAAPSALTATAASQTQVNLTWTDNSSNETGFYLDRATNSGFTANLVTTTLGANVTSSSATGLTASTTYYFRVRAYNAGGSSANTSTASATTQAAAPAAPSGLTAAAVSQTQINTAWTDNSSNETGFYIDRATNSGFTAGLVTSSVGANVTTFNATGLTANTTYYFRVRAYNGTGSSANSSTVSTTTLPNAPTAPSGLAGTVTSNTQINLSWTDNSSNETGFYIDRALDSGFTQSLVTSSVGANVTTFSATGLASSTTYYFRARAYNAGGSSANTSTINKTTNADPVESITSAAAGNWSSASTWTGGIIPGSVGHTGAVVTLNHNVTMDMDVTLGTNTAVATCLTIVNGKTLTVNTGKTLKVRGNVIQQGQSSTGAIATFNAGSALVFDSTKLTATSTVLWWQISDGYYNGGATLATLNLNGTSLSHVSVSAVSGGGAGRFKSSIYDAGDQIFATYADFSRIGDATYMAFNPIRQNRTDLNPQLSLTYCTFNTCGVVSVCLNGSDNTYGLLYEGSFIVQHCTFTNSQGAYTVHIGGGMAAPNSGQIWDVSYNTFDKAPLFDNYTQNITHVGNNM